MGTRLFVGNLSYSTSEAALRGFFEAADNKVVDVKIINDRETGRSRGFGFVELDTETDATRSIERLNGAELDGRRLAIREAHDPPNRGGPRRDGPPRPPVTTRGGGGGPPRRDFGPPGGGPRPEGPPPWAGGGEEEGRGEVPDHRSVKQKWDGTRRRKGKGKRRHDQDRDDDF